MTNVSSQEINALAISNEFSQLCEVLFAPGAHKSQSIASIIARHPQLRAEQHEVEALYDDLLLETAAKYTGCNAKGEPVDFLQCLNQALKLRSLTLRSKVVGRAAIVSYEQTMEENGDAAVPESQKSSSSEETYFSDFESEDREMEWVDAQLDELGVSGAVRRAAIKSRYRHDTSLDEVANISGHFFKNRQDVWRQTVGAAKRSNI